MQQLLRSKAFNDSLLSRLIYWCIKVHPVTLGTQILHHTVYQKEQARCQSQHM